MIYIIHMPDIFDLDHDLHDPSVRTIWYIMIYLIYLSDLSDLDHYLSARYMRFRTRSILPIGPSYLTDLIHMFDLYDWDQYQSNLSICPINLIWIMIYPSICSIYLVWIMICLIYLSDISDLEHYLSDLTDLFDLDHDLPDESVRTTWSDLSA